MDHIIESIRNLCVEENLDYQGQRPVGVGPGVYKFYATPLVEECRKKGHCRQHEFYAVDMGNKWVLS